MKSIRSSLQRHFFKTLKVDIIHDIQFIEANAVFNNALKIIKSAGKGETEHYPEIEPEDIRKLCESFDINNLIILMVFKN